MADKKPADRYPDSEGPFAGPNNTFPLNTAARVKNAWARIHQGPTKANHSAEEIASIKAKIRRRAKELGIELEEHDNERSLKRNGAPPTERLYTTSFSDGLRVETRSMPDGSPGRVIGGYAAVFGKRSHPMGGLREVVESSFFRKSQADGWPMAVARYEHNPLMLLGSTASGTLQLNIDNTGLDYSVNLPEHRSDVWELAERRDLPGSSFSFQSYQDDWKLGDNGYPERHLVTGRLVDVAPTAIPAYPDATLRVAYRSLAMQMDADVHEVEEYAAEDNLRVFFHRTDNIDKRDNSMSEPEIESRTAAVEDKPGTHFHVHLEGVGNKTEPVKEPEPEAKLEPEVKEPEPEARPEPEAKEPESEPKPEPEPEPEVLPTMTYQAARTRMRERDNRAES